MITYHDVLPYIQARKAHQRHALTIKARIHRLLSDIALAAVFFVVCVIPVVALIAAVLGMAEAL